MLRLLPGILLAAALWSCTHEELPDPAEEAGIPLIVQVTDAGFVPGTPGNGGPSTRMTEEGYKTIFTEGDTIGIYTCYGILTADYNIPLCLPMRTANRYGRIREETLSGTTVKRAGTMPTIPIGSSQNSRSPLSARTILTCFSGRSSRSGPSPLTKAPMRNTPPPT